jgi:hypothetical protein
MKNWEKLLKKWQEKLKIKFKKREMDSSFSPIFILSPESWLNLIFEPYLNLDELIFMQRTCRVFATHERLKLLVETKIKNVMGVGIVPKKHWNRECVCDKNWFIPHQAEELYMINWSFLDDRNYCEKDYVVVYSTKERIIKRFYSSLLPRIKEYNPKREHITFCKERIRFSAGNEICCVYNITQIVLPDIIRTVIMIGGNCKETNSWKNFGLYGNVLHTISLYQDPCVLDLIILIIANSKKNCVEFCIASDVLYINKII